MRLCIIILVTLLLIIIPILIYYSSNSKSKNTLRGIKNGYRCNGYGCSKTKNGEYGEYFTEKECKETCKSYNLDHNCSLKEGVPWHSFATKKACIRNLFK